MRQLACLTVAAYLCAAHGTAQSADLPPRDAFLTGAREAIARSQRLWHRYSYTERRTELHMNPFGRMGTGDTLLLEVRPSPNPQLTYRKLIERNGVPLPKAELDRQEADYRARVARAEREAGRGDADEARRREQDDELAQRRAQRMVDDVIGTLRFEIDRREYLHGRPVIIVSFKARPDARPVTREGRLAKVFKGELRIDEQSRELIDLKAVATDDVSFGGFIAKVYQGTEATVERREIEPGVWMPTRLTLSGTVRALFRRAQIDHAIEWFDYRRINH